MPGGLHTHHTHLTSSPSAPPPAALCPRGPRTPAKAPRTLFCSFPHQPEHPHSTGQAFPPACQWVPAMAPRSLPLHRGGATPAAACGERTPLHSSALCALPAVRCLPHPVAQTPRPRKSAHRRVAAAARRLTPPRACPRKVFSVPPRRRLRDSRTDLRDEREEYKRRCARKIQNPSGNVSRRASGVKVIEQHTARHGNRR